MPDNPVLQKLRLRSGQRAIVLGAPESYRAVLAEPLAGVELAPDLSGQLDFVHCFVTSLAELERQDPALKAALEPDGLLWVSYPRGDAIATDLERDVVREALERIGLKAVAQVAIDEVWSAVRFKHA